ncbi:PREDICTED: protein phosphatase 1 regulatory subunit 12A isoform X2 [Drosophila arizonae]|uniref:Protein phosphatase 1 regulatory subunit 12A isoform X2 n=1 Tax=Drosophila arizonae TaxID=7263 RepID=A0ABM1PW49_DROAR|nr:PREDICTED: protein phosphatase 1 regulatory subunit 12A isoform X2 [Drosophila arizonae]
MADPNGFKLFRSVDPTTVNVPIKEKFAKLTLSSNKKQQLARKTTPQPKPQPEQQSIKSSNVSRQLLGELNDLAAAKSYEHPLLRSDSSSSHAMGQEHTPKADDARSQLDVSDYMETLHMSCTQQTIDVDVEALSTQVTNLTMQPEKGLPPEQSICISSTTAESDDDSASCITISDSSVSEHGEQQTVDREPEQTSMAVSEQLPPTAPNLSNVKVQRIEAFLRDVSFERREIQRRGCADMSGDITRLASADTESMSIGDVDCTELLSVSQWQADSSKRLADNDTEIGPMCSEEQVDSSKRLAHNDTEVNTVCSEEQVDGSKRLADNDTEVNTELNTVCSAEEVNSSKRLADNDTEVNTVCSEDSSKRLANDDTEVNTPDLEVPLSDVSGQQTTLDETIPETSSELEHSPPRPVSASSAEPEESVHSAAIQVSSINISAKINIKIHIPTLDSSSEVEQSIVETTPTSKERADSCKQQEQKEQEREKEKEKEREQDKEQEREQECEKEQEQQQERECSVLGSDASEDEQFLTQAEKLLNQLYGKSWQTPDVIRTLKRSSGSGGKTASVGAVRRAPLTEIKRQPRQPKAATAKKAAPAAQPNDSAVGDFSIFRRALNSNKFNSTQLPRAICSERRPGRPQVRTKHIDEERWRALIDTDSGTDASDDDDANATESSETSDGEEQENGHVTYLDLTKKEVEVVSDPDEQDTGSSKPHKRLDDILRKYRATDKPKLPATPVTPVTTPASSNPTRRQLFTPNTGYEDSSEAIKIVDQALDLNSLEQLELIYLPGTNVHKRIQEVKKQLGMGVATPKAKPVFKKRTPRPIPAPTRAEPVMNEIVMSEPCGFLKSLEPQISREFCDREAFYYRENYARVKDRLTTVLYNLYNTHVFNESLDVQVAWSPRLRNTAGTCRNKTISGGVRTSRIELSTKVLTSADRLRSTLIHELCHAAAWVFNGATGHGVVWKNWAKRAMNRFPDLPPITVCHNYEIEFKYTYKCRSHAHSKSRKCSDLRCRFCLTPIDLYINKKNKMGVIEQTPVRPPMGFAKFVKDNFQKYNRDNLGAANVMRILGAEYAKKKAALANQLDVTEQLANLSLNND